MIQCGSQARIDHTLKTYRRFIADLRQAIFSGNLHVPPEVIACPQPCDFGSWLEGMYVQHDSQTSISLASLKQAHIVLHRDAAQIARFIAEDRPDAAHEAFHRPEFVAAGEDLLVGLAELRGLLRAAA